MTDRAWETLETKTILDARYLKVVRHKVRLPGGAMIDDYNVVESPAWAAAVCITAQQEVVLIKQYRHGHQDISLELPAGIIDPGEEPLQAAIRELEEETGYVGDGAQLFWKIRPEPARHRQWAHFALVKNARPKKQQALESTEDIQVILWPLADIDAALKQMVHAAHVGALLFALREDLLGTS